MERVIKIKKWTSNIHNSNEKRVKTCLKEILPNYKNISWTEELYINFLTEILNSLPSRYKQKNSIEINGKLKKQVIKDAILEKLNEM